MKKGFKMPDCRWVLESKLYCCKPVKYHIKLDDDENPKRVYDTFCEEHMKRSLEQEKE